MKNLKFIPIHRYMKFGNEIQMCKTEYKGVTIYNQTYIPFNLFKHIVDTYSLELIFKMDTEIKNGKMNCDGIYIQEGYGSPEFNTIEEAIDFIDYYTDNKEMFLNIDYQSVRI